jgi:hypothetical protein
MMERIKAPLVLTIMIFLFGFGMYGVARNAEKGTKSSYRGKASGQAVGAVAVAIGSKVCLAMWLGGTALSGVWLGRSFKEPKSKPRKGRR